MIRPKISHEQAEFLRAIREFIEIFDQAQIPDCSPETPEYSAETIERLMTGWLAKYRHNKLVATPLDFVFGLDAEDDL